MESDSSNKMLVIVTRWSPPPLHFLSLTLPLPSPLPLPLTTPPLRSLALSHYPSPNSHSLKLPVSSPSPHTTTNPYALSHLRQLPQQLDDDEVLERLDVCLELGVSCQKC